MDNMIRFAKKEEAEKLTEISFQSKRYWKYPEDYFDIWKDELTITAEYIEINDVFVFELEGATVGYYSIVELPDDISVSGIEIEKGFWLEHMFLQPEYIGQGFGTRMFEHLRGVMAKKKINVLGVLADPNSRGFYEKMGCEYQKEFPSTIKNRTTPFLLFKGL